MNQRQVRIQDFQRQESKLQKKGQTNIKQKRNEYKSYIGDIAVPSCELDATKLSYTYNRK